MTDKVLCVVGTRPEVIKMAPVVHALRAAPELAVTVLCSGQHRELPGPLMEWFELAFDADLGAMSENQSLAQLTARLMEVFERQLTRERPDLVLVQGDTTTVMCAALCCFYLDIPVGHVEAGLRTFDLRNPFPEEFNRVAVTRLARLHFCPTARAKENVLAERAAPAAVYVTGNTVIDALQFTVRKLGHGSPRQFDHDILVTAHRRENFGAPLASICAALRELCAIYPSLRILYPVHPNPNVRTAVEQALGSHPRIALVAPLPYPDLVAAMQQSRLILTDSGGLQEEAPALGKPVLVLREITERPEAVELGVAKVVGTQCASIVAETRRLLDEPEYYARFARGGSPYGDGHAAARISDAVRDFLRQRVR